MNKTKTEKYILLLKGIAIGVLTGVTIGAFRLMISGIESIRTNIENMNYIALAVFFLIIYLAICTCLKVDKNCSGSGFPRVKGELAGKIETDWLKDMITMMIASSCSVGAGLSMGKIGPSAHIGAMIAKGFSKKTKKIKSDDRLFMTAGAGAGCAAILHAPLAGIAFTLEETNKSFSIEVLLIAISSCITSDFIVSDCFALDPIYSIPLSNSIPIVDCWKLILLALIMGLMGVLYNITLQATQKLYSLTKSIWIKIFIPVAATAVLVIVFPEITGTGDSLIENCKDFVYPLKAVLIILVARYIFTMVCFASGCPGGLIGPVIVIGGITGYAFGLIAGSEEVLMNYILYGMAGYFTAVLNTPITGIILFSEITGSFTYLPGIALVCIVSYMVSDLMKSRPVFELLLDKILDDN